MRPSCFPVMVFALIACSYVQAASGDITSSISECNRAIGEGDAAKALAYAEQVLKQDKSNRDALLCKGRAYGGTGQTTQALEALQSAERLSQTPIEHIVALSLIGNVYKTAGRNEEALASYRQVLALARNDKDQRFERISLNLIGETQIAMHQLEAALDSYMAGSKLAANDNERGNNFARIASVYSDLGKYDLAIEYQIKAVLMEERSGDPDHRANAGLELGRIYTLANDYPNAEKSIGKIIKFSKEQGGAFWEAKSYYYLALAKSVNNQKDAAKTLLADAQQICEEIGAQSLSDEIAAAMSKLTK